MRYKIAICDDSAADRNYIQDLTLAWVKERRIDASISPFSSAENFLFQYQEEKDFDILLLDIEMGQMDGVSLAKTLRKDNETVQIIFVTGYSDYISEGYEVEALHYLMKPVKEMKLREVLDRALDKLSKNEKVLNLEVGGEMVRIPVYQIKYLDVQANYVTIHAKEDYTIKKTLSQLAAELDDRFYKVGRSAVVNLTHINRVTKTDIYLKDGSQIPLPRGAYEGVNRAIISMN
ncbi:MAG: response regulator transcription factor [Lachnospiraceae bacterium]|nr:response regulator transcription factor [Lachnospiraceae bacterium]